MRQRKGGQPFCERRTCKGRYQSPQSLQLSAGPGPVPWNTWALTAGISRRTRPGESLSGHHQTRRLQTLHVWATSPPRSNRSGVPAGTPRPLSLSYSLLLCGAPSAVAPPPPRRPSFLLLHFPRREERRTSAAVLPAPGGGLAVNTPPLLPPTSAASGKG